MGEALLIKTGGTDSGSSSGRNGLITEIFMTNTMWQVPEGIRNNQVSVRIFGGGGCAGYYYGGQTNTTGGGGGGGEMNFSIINIYNENLIPVIIGEGAKCVEGRYINITSGGTTSFGKYLSANGGQSSKGYNGANGGSGGGSHYFTIGDSAKAYHGGDGYQFGGGGSGFYAGSKDRIQYSNGRNWVYSYFGKGGNGGKWGGGGGSGLVQSPGIGGLYGGNGGYINYNADANRANFINAENGYNMALDSQNLINSNKNLIIDGTELGYGLAGKVTGETNFWNTGGAGGGGCGGNGGLITGYNCSCGGGGGLCANGGDGGWTKNESGIFIAVGGGGGGGYCGGDGGKGSIYGGGGGGGYGIYGKGAGWNNADGTGFHPAGIAAGGAGNITQVDSNGGSGICIIQYYLD